MTSFIGANSPFEALRRVAEMGFPTCQLGNPPPGVLYGPRAAELTAELRRAVAETGVRITAVFIMYEGHIWDLIGGPGTIGLIPVITRGERVVHACRMSDWAREAGIDAVTSHIGFIPEDAADPAYPPFLATMKAFCEFVRQNGQTLAFRNGSGKRDAWRGRSRISACSDPA